MIPKRMREFLWERLPEATLRNRLVREGDRCYLEFGPLDIDRLSRLDIEVDNLGPRLVVCMWDEGAPIEIGGYLVVDNLAMGQPSMGGIRMLPNISPAAIHNLARGMTLKNAAADLPYGGGKSGIVAERGLSPEEHTAVVRGFAHLIRRYQSIYLPGPDVGTNDSDMKTIGIENGLDNALSKPIEMGGNRIDELGAAAGGVIIALEALLEEMPRLGVLPQFRQLVVPASDAVSVLIQGFGAVGAHAARILQDRLPDAQVIGISDLAGYLFDDRGLPVDDLFNTWQSNSLVCQNFYETNLANQDPVDWTVKYSTAADDLLREDGFCLIPAAPIANYLDTDIATDPSMTVGHMGKWALIIEGANTYSPDLNRKLARSRMERAVYRERGVLIATDYLVNSGGVIFAAQEHLIKTPDNLRIPTKLLGDQDAVKQWLGARSDEFDALAEERLAAAERYREDVIRRNMRELVDLLITDADMLPCEAAERISIRRIAASESDRTAEELMEPMPSLEVTCNVQQAAAKLIESGSPILAIISIDRGLVGVVTEWDITQATAEGCGEDTPIDQIMTRKVVAAAPDDPILEVVQKLEHHEISAMPIVAGGVVHGMISADLLARRSLLRLLQSRID